MSKIKYLMMNEHLIIMFDLLRYPMWWIKLLGGQFIFRRFANAYLLHHGLNKIQFIIHSLISYIQTIIYALTIYI